MSSETMPAATSTLFGSDTSSTTAPFGSFASGAPLGTSSASTSSGFTFGSPSTTTSGSFGMSSKTIPAATSTLFGSGTSSNTAFGTAPFAFATSTESFGANGAAMGTEKEANINYDVAENVAVNEDQAERIYQKWQHRKK
ncbi:unnamed protein product [Adineta steineri]|uniref:Uncharacterized protein n=1 Tax=Adineta steineri TaxID=433720 RepID=A0A813PZP2_9BILA|nr:unnamed protein product [Adineta steineri]CAF0796097.1 unnamed protein product [Adineta steineri]